VRAAKAGGQTLDHNNYVELERPTEHDPVRRYASVVPDLYEAIVARTAGSGSVALEH